ncbi:MAG TPA: dihydrolipoamide acetyltransferase family protein [Actinomycetota bacterium]|nr:dihydrolipoamide acetyltransferase family protein [Actinomycetota bacterium]
MERVFHMPDLGEGLEEGRIVAWLVAEGEDVALNQPLVEVETAKAAVEIPSPFAGRIVVLHGDVDTDVPVGAPLTTFDVDAVPAPLPETDDTEPRTARISAAVRIGEQRDVPVKATPPVRKRAKDLGIDIGTVNGTGPDGRITEDDVRRVAEHIGRPDRDGVVAVAVHQDVGSRLEPVGEVRHAIAATLTSQIQIPQVTTFRTVDCTELERARRELGVSPLPIVVAALAAVARDHPLLNAMWLEDMIEFRDAVNVGLAVDTERGLMVPVLQDAGRRGIGDIAAEIDRLATAARNGSLAFEEKVATATIAVSNTGSYDSEAGTPILSPNTSVTIALGVIQPRALVVGDDIVARPAATLSMTFDHRVLDGATAGRALTDLVALLESPERLGGLPR